MPENESIIAKYPEDGSITFINRDTGEKTVYPHIAPPPPDKILMRDETGQPWAITVGTDGQLQTAKCEMPKLEFTDDIDGFKAVPLAELLGNQDQKA